MTKRFLINPTKEAPKIFLDPNRGIFNIEGRLLMLDCIQN